MTAERRQGATELRVEGRRLSGTVMRYGEVSPSHRERFEPGSLRMAESVHLDLHHDVERAVAWHPGGGLTLDNGRAALTMTAELPPIPAADHALDEIRSGAVGGLSVEFRPLKERRDADVRVIEDAVLSGIGIVRAPSYKQSNVEARRRSGRTLRGEYPGGRNTRLRVQHGLALGAHNPTGHGSNVEGILRGRNAGDCRRLSRELPVAYRLDGTGHASRPHSRSRRL